MDEDREEYPAPLRQRTRAIGCKPARSEKGKVARESLG